MKKEKVVCYHHNDGDGKMAAGVVATIHPEAEFREINYNYPFDFDGLEESLVIVVDFSFPDMMELKGKCKKLIWIDHHETAMKDQKEAWESKEIEGLREIGKCGAWLAWTWFYDGKDVLYPIELINDYDLWIKKHSQSDAFNERISLEKDIVFFKMIIEDAFRMIDLVGEGDVLLEQKQKRVDSSIKRGVEKSFEGRKVFWINSSPSDVSMTGAEILEDDYDIAVMYFFDKDEIIFGMRSKEGINVGDIAKRYGGGGHAKAAGFHLPIKEGIKLIQ